MTISSMYFQRTVARKYLTISFDENDDIMAGVLQVMRERNISEASFHSCQGTIAGGSGTFLNGNQLQTFQFNNTAIKTATGHFRVSAKSSLSILKVIPADFDTHVTLGKALAGADFEIKLSYYEF